MLLAFGYPGPGARNPKGRVWGIYAAHTATAADWVTFLSGLNLPAPPESVVCDDNLGGAGRADPAVGPRRAVSALV